MTLDIPEAQLAVFYEDDPNFIWHVRVLLIRLKDGGGGGNSPKKDKKGGKDE